MDKIKQLLGALYGPLADLQGIPLYVFLLVIFLTILFLLGYAIKGTQVWWQLRSITRSVSLMRSGKKSPEPDQVGRLFKWAPFKHLWAEYADTLHVVQKASSGRVALTEVRATVPAEMYFTREVLVDGRLFDEFTRHLPGVLTGLGIIGTFAGLIGGLRNFKPTPIDEALKGLGPLLEGVQHAFLASGAAIACAMLVVFISRFTLALLYRLVEKLTHSVDRLYEMGAGEEYLARLVKSSEQSAATTAQLKDALVEDLNKMMTNLVERQIAAHEISNRTMGQQIGESISTAIAEPMKRVGDAIEATSKGNGDQVNNMLQTLLTGFMDKLEDTFGGQMRGINETMQRSTEAMASVQSSLQGLLSDIKAANEHAAQQMSGTLEQTMKKAADNQQLLVDQMREFAQDFHRSATEEQGKTKQAMDEAVMKVLGDVAAHMESMENVRRAAASEESGRNEQLAQQTNTLVGGLTTHVETLLQSVSEQVGKTQDNVDALGKVSTRAIEGMNQGASTMGAAAERFGAAGSAVAETFERSKTVAETLATTAASLQTAALAVQRGFEQYDSTRKNVDAQVAALMGFIEAAKTEAGVSQNLVASIEASAKSMRQSEEESRGHLNEVNDALVKAFKSFGDSLVSQVKHTIAETDGHLSKGVGNLKGVVEELANAVQRMKKA